MKLAALVLTIVSVVCAKDRIAAIEFFGYKGVDVEAVRRALPFHVGDARSKSLREDARKAVKDATDIASICCNANGDAVVFIGLPGASSHPFQYAAAPAGDVPPSPELLQAYRRLEKAEEAAIRKGNLEEDGSPGFRLLKEPAARAAGIAFHEFAVRHEDEMIGVLQGDRHANLRALAADALGFAARTPPQIAALLRAVRDPDDEVRNNATRALAEILRADATVAAQVPPDAFIELVRSGVWTDRNKGSAVLAPLTESRDPKLLARIKAEAWDELAEMARWSEAGWAGWPRTILARVAGFSEERIMDLAYGTPDAFFAALGAAVPAGDRIGAIAFFGYKGLDVEAVRRALPFHVGDPLADTVEVGARAAVRRVTGREATGISQICCTADGGSAMFIGLPGESSRPFRFNAAPSGDAPVSRELATLYEKKMEALGAAVKKGKGEEDGAPGYNLLKEPRTRALQLATREYALRHEDEIVRTLQEDRRGEQRAIAADALGYGARTERQLAALVRACRDADESTRNNAIRALGEILRGDPSVGAKIAPEPFIELVRSAVWTDRNKGSMALMGLTASRDPKLLARIKAEAWDELAEMARWPGGWKLPGRLILGRIAGFSDEQLLPLLDSSNEAFFAAVRR
jgi:HEAT repeat protein